MKAFLLFLSIAVCLSCHKHEPEKGLISEILADLPQSYDKIKNNPAKYKLQMVFTQINRDQNNSPQLNNHIYRVDSEYFYPASTIKFPMALLTMEKLNELSIAGLSMDSKMCTDSAYYGQTSSLVDPSARSGYPSVGHYIKKIFLVSDNEAFNRLYEFVGQKAANEKLWKKAYPESRIRHRLSVFLPGELNRYTNPIRFYAGQQLIYQQALKYNTHALSSSENLPIGRAYYAGDSLIHAPMDFSTKNRISLFSLHQMMQSLVFPGIFNDQNKFNLNAEDRAFVLKYMSMFPRESTDPEYGSHYEDGYCKLFLFGGSGNNQHPHIRIFNKVGEAYGFLTDIAYIVDFKNKVEFFLSTTVYVNENGISGDDHYEYESLGYPFLKELGWAFYQNELNRNRANLPDLESLIIDYAN